MNEPLPSPEIESTEESSEESTRRKRYQSVGDAMSAGRQAAENKAKTTAPALADLVGAAIQDVAYGTAFGICFTGYFARELVPASLRKNVVRGLRRGKTAAKQFAEDLCDKPEQAAADTMPDPA